MVDKDTGAKVYGGTMNKSGALALRVEAKLAEFEADRESSALDARLGLRGRVRGPKSAQFRNTISSAR